MALAFLKPNPGPLSYCCSSFLGASLIGELPVFRTKSPLEKPVVWFISGRSLFLLSSRSAFSCCTLRASMRPVPRPQPVFSSSGFSSGFLPSSRAFILYSLAIFLSLSILRSCAILFCSLILRSYNERVAFSMTASFTSVATLSLNSIFFC